MNLHTRGRGSSGKILRATAGPLILKMRRHIHGIAIPLEACLDLS